MKPVGKSPSPESSYPRPGPIPGYIKADRGRSSLDIPRSVAHWGSTNDTQSKSIRQPSKTRERPIFRRTETDASRPRPVSMGPWSPPRTPPSLTVQSPQESPGINRIKFPVSHSPSYGQRETTEHYKPSLPPPIPPSRLSSRSPSSEKVVRGSKTWAPETAQDLPQRILPSGVTKPSPVPPPVNRADKPQVRLNRSPLDVSSGSAKLEPVKPTVTVRTSPFSTPPSSDESSVLEETASNGSQEAHVKNNRAVSSGQGYFPPPPTHRSVRKQLEKPSYTQTQRQDPRTNGLVELSHDQRQGLPKQRTFEGSFANSQDDGGGNVATQLTRTSTFDHQRQAPPPGPTPYITGRVTIDARPPPTRNTPPKTQDSTSNSAPFSESSGIVSANMPSKLQTRNMPGGSMRRIEPGEPGMIDSPLENGLLSKSEYPDGSRTNRRPPRPQAGIPHIETKYETRLFDISGNYVCSTGYLTRAWDLNSGRVILDMSHGERETKVTAIAFKPGATSEEEGMRIWLGSNHGDIQEVDLESGEVVYTKQAAHSRRDILRIHRHQNSMWSLDDEGKLHVWPPDEKGLPNLHNVPLSHRIAKGHSFSIVIKDQLWLATGKDIRIYKPGVGEEDPFNVTQFSLTYPGAGEITSGAIISNQLERVYFGHTDGKVTMYSTLDYSFLGVVNVSVYKISSLAGAGNYLWAGYNTGMIYVYDTAMQPWDVKKDWQAHDGPVATILVDRSSVWRLGRLQVASIGLDNAIRMWDGLLAEDWLGL